MKTQNLISMLTLTLAISTVSQVGFAAEKTVVNGVQLNTEESLGYKIFSDKNLSNPVGQACMSCHSPTAAFADPNSSMPVSLGTVHGKSGGRNAPTAMYMKYAGKLHQEKEKDGSLTWEGGFFWDGRANSLEDQAKGPFLNPVEMNETKEGVVKKVCSSTYATEFKAAYGAQVCNSADIEKSYDAVAKAIATFEKSRVFSPFTSKFDAVMARTDKFTESELRGYRLFKSEKKANCAACHSMETDNSSHRALFTDFTYDNIGLPSNSLIPSVVEKIRAGSELVDLGLAVTVKDKEMTGKFKVPTLRNISKTAPYMHNGYFKNLRDVVEFYNTRDTKAVCTQKIVSADNAKKLNCWPAAEMAQTMNKEELGNLRLTDQEIDDVVAFLKTLDDGYKGK